MQERKIPTLLGLILVVLAVVIFRFAFDRVTPLISRATTQPAPQDVVFTNISDTSFTVTWLTATPTTGAVVIDGIAQKSTLFDERDTVGAEPATKPQGKYVTHSVNVRDLTPDRTYVIRILVDGKQYEKEGLSYEIRTATAIPGNGTSLEPAYGKIIYATGEPAEGAIVYLTPDGGQTFSALVTSSGSWVIPLNFTRTETLDAYIGFSERIDERIIVRSAEGDSEATTDTINDNPVPDMTIGKTYDFKKIRAENGGTPNLATNTQITITPSVLGSNTATQAIVAITKPAQGGAVASNLPLIQGTGVNGATVSILLGIERPVTDRVTVGTDGVWYYTPKNPLSEGKQSVTITTQDAQKRTVAVTHTFEILKSGTQVLGDATPSATLTPEPTDTPAIEEEPEPTATLAGEPIPETGFPLPLIILLTLGVLLMGGGAFAYIK